MGKNMAPNPNAKIEYLAKQHRHCHTMALARVKECKNLNGTQNAYLLR